MERSCSYLYERQYLEEESKDRTLPLENYWRKLLGEEVFEKLQKNNENFEKYLNQNIYIKAEEKISHLKEYVTKYKGCKKRVSRDKILQNFMEFYLSMEKTD